MTTAKLTDFGLAKSFQQAGLSGMTATGFAAGTLQFMPREQLTNFRLLRPASDVWSMGATVYYMLTLRYVRDFQAAKDPLAVVLGGNVVPIRDRKPQIPAALAEVVVDGRVLDGPNAVAGEWGHNPLPWPKDDERPGADVRGAGVVKGHAQHDRVPCPLLPS